VRYYTSHDLTVIEGANSLIAELIAENEEAAYAIDSNGDAEESCKWYSHQEDLRAFSKKHPKALFELKGEGEESGDIWAEYYRNGKLQVCKAIIAYPKFDESLLS
jgi:hypothetical protein